MSQHHEEYFMTKHTKRDKIWSTALRIGDDGVFTVEDVLREAGLPESSERTCHDVLTTMHELGHLDFYRGKDRGAYYAPPDLYEPDESSYPTAFGDEYPMGAREIRSGETGELLYEAPKFPEVW